MESNNSKYTQEDIDKIGIDVFGDEKNYFTWYKRKNKFHGNKSPSELSLEDVHTWLMQIEYGIYS